MQGPLFHIVLVEPEIPNNTGAIGRTCIVTGCALHLVHPLGFDTSEKALRRAGLDYWARLDVRHHDNWEAFLSWWHSSPNCGDGSSTGQGHVSSQHSMWLTSGKSGKPLWTADIRRGDCLVFGKETAGLSGDILAAHADRTLTLPMLPNERGMNLANVATAAVYEGVRQCVNRGEVAIDGDGRLR